MALCSNLQQRTKVQRDSTIDQTRSRSERSALAWILLCGAAGNRTRFSTRQFAFWAAGSLRLRPVHSRSLPAVSFSGLDGVKTAAETSASQRTTQLTAASCRCRRSAAASSIRCAVL